MVRTVTLKGEVEPGLGECVSSWGVRAESLELYFNHLPKSFLPMLGTGLCWMD